MNFAIASLGAALILASPAHGAEVVTASATESPLAARASVKPRARTDWDAVVGGSALFMLGYGPCVATSIARDTHGGTGWLLAPVAGPWVALATHADVNPWALSLAGIAQLGGAALVALGATSPPRVLGPPRSDSRRTRSSSQAWVLTPSLALTRERAVAITATIRP